MSLNLIQPEARWIKPILMNTEFIKCHLYTPKDNTKSKADQCFKTIQLGQGSMRIVTSGDLISRSGIPAKVRTL